MKKGRSRYETNPERGNGPRPSIRDEAPNERGEGAEPILRDKVVEAMAQAMSGLSIEEWQAVEEAEREIWLMQASAALDAALDILGENVNEWLDGEQAAYSIHRRPFVAGLLAVLRAGKGSDE